MSEILAYVGVDGGQSLSNTAEALGTALNVKFVEDREGAFDEFPAFIARTPTVTYALLGNPLPEYEIRDAPSNDYELQVSSTHSGSPLPLPDSSSTLAGELQVKSGIRCWPLDA